MSRRVFNYLGHHHWGILATFIALGGSAYAFGGGGARTHVHACVSRVTGVVRISRHCRRSERSLSWARIGPQGAVGPSDGYYSSTANHAPGIASVTVPPGHYIANGGCTATQNQTAIQSTTVPALGEAVSYLTTTLAVPINEFAAARTSASVPNMGVDGNTPAGPGPSRGSASLSASAAFHLPNGGRIYEVCGAAQGERGFGKSQAPVSVSNLYITAIRVGRLHHQ